MVNQRNTIYRNFINTSIIIDTTDTSTLDLDQLERTGPSYVVLPEQV